MDRAEFIGSLSRAGREARAFGAIYAGAVIFEPADESGVRLVPCDESNNSEATFDATDDAEPVSSEEMTQRVIYRGTEA